MKVKVRLFASLREEVGQEAVELEVTAPADVKALLASFRDCYPDAPSAGNLLVAVNEEIARPETAVEEGDEVGLLPPVSGGGSLKRVVREDFNTDAVLAEIGTPAEGALVTFTGSVRSESGGRRVEILRYEVYEAMAERMIREIEAEVAEASEAHRVLVQHRAGDLKPGERTILVAATAPHRGEAFEACRRALERVKAEVPVWKKEIYGDGTEVWVEPHPHRVPPED